MSRYLDEVIVLAIAFMILIGLSTFRRAKEAEYEYYVYAKHLVHHQLEEKGCVYMEREQTDE